MAACAVWGCSLDCTGLRWRRRGGVERGALTAQPSAVGHDQRAVDIVLAAGQVDDTPPSRARRLQSALDGGRRARTRPAAAALLEGQRPAAIHGEGGVAPPARRRHVHQAGVGRGGRGEHAQRAPAVMRGRREAVGEMSHIGACAAWRCSGAAGRVNLSGLSHRKG